MTVESCLLLRLWLKEQKHGQMLDKFQWQCSISEVYLWTIIFSWQVIFKLSTCNLYDDSDIKGGYDGSDSHDSILQFNPDDGSWTQVGQLQTARHYHGASVVSVDDIIDYCNWFHNFIFNIKKFSIILYLNLITFVQFYTTADLILLLFTNFNIYHQAPPSFRWKGTKLQIFLRKSIVSFSIRYENNYKHTSKLS